MFGDSEHYKYLTNEADLNNMADDSIALTPKTPKRVSYLNTRISFNPLLLCWYFSLTQSLEFLALELQYIFLLKFPHSQIKLLPDFISFLLL